MNVCLCARAMQKSGTRCLGFLNRWPFQHTRLSARTPANPKTHTQTQNYDHRRLHARKLLPDQLHNVSFLRQQTLMEDGNVTVWRNIELTVFQLFLTLHFSFFFVEPVREGVSSSLISQSLLSVNSVSLSSITNQGP